MIIKPIYLIAAAIIIFAIGVLVGKFRKKLKISQLITSKLSKDYYQGLNYLIAEKPDRALDVFVNMLDVDNQTVELHLLLGNLFRRQGEVERAIRIHQNLIARPQLSKTDKSKALLALAQDYLHAGVLDRAERLFLQLLDSNDQINESSKALLRIYQTEQDWNKALNLAKKVQKQSKVNLSAAISHYYCELALVKQQQGDLNEATAYLKKALVCDARCVRASILLGNLALDAQKFKHAQTHYQTIEQQDPAFLSEILSSLSTCYRELNQLNKLHKLLEGYMQRYPSAYIVAAIAHYYSLAEGVQAAIQYVSSQLHIMPMLLGMQSLISLALKAAHGDAKLQFQALEQALNQCLSQSTMYRCVECGYRSSQLHWLCPQCAEWGSIKPKLTN